jgi:hypothetical protein
MKPKSLKISLLAGTIFFLNCASTNPILEYLKTSDSSYRATRSEKINGETKYFYYFPACNNSGYLLKSPPYSDKKDCIFAESEMKSPKIIKQYLVSHKRKDLESAFAKHDDGDHIITPEEFNNCGLDKLSSE